MSQDPTCAYCQAGCLDLQGICTECDGCMRLHCQCDPCQHGKTREEACFFCGRGNVALFSAVVQADDIDGDLRWLVGHTEELA